MLDIKEINAIKDAMLYIKVSDQELMNHWAQNQNLKKFDKFNLRTAQKLNRDAFNRLAEIIGFKDLMDVKGAPIQ